AEDGIRDKLVTGVQTCALPISPAGLTPLSETLYEAYQYYSGGNVFFGNTSQPSLSVDGSRVAAGSNQYKTPILYQCQKNFMVYRSEERRVGKERSVCGTTHPRE